MAKGRARRAAGNAGRTAAEVRVANRQFGQALVPGLNARAARRLGNLYDQNRVRVGTQGAARGRAAGFNIRAQSGAGQRRAEPVRRRAARPRKRR